MGFIYVDYVWRSRGPLEVERERVHRPSLLRRGPGVPTVLPCAAHGAVGEAGPAHIPTEGGPRDGQARNGESGPRAEEGSGLRAGDEMNRLRIARKWDPGADMVLYEGDCRDLLEKVRETSGKTFRLVITSPPYNLAKPYEKKRLAESEYRKLQVEAIRGCYDVLLDHGSICWQVGNFVDNGEVVPLDVVLWPIFTEVFGMKMR